MTSWEEETKVQFNDQNHHSGGSNKHGFSIFFFFFPSIMVLLKGLDWHALMCIWIDGVVNVMNIRHVLLVWPSTLKGS